MTHTTKVMIELADALDVQIVAAMTESNGPKSDSALNAAYRNLRAAIDVLIKMSTEEELEQSSYGRS